MKKQLQHIIIWLVAMSILNSSIGIPASNNHDFANCTAKRPGNCNHFESIAEWVAEKVMNIQNAVPELHHKNSNQHVILKKHAPDYVLARFQKSKVRHSMSSCTVLPVIKQEQEKPLSGFISLFSPPPDMLAV